MKQPVQKTIAALVIFLVVLGLVGNYVGDDDAPKGVQAQLDAPTVAPSATQAPLETATLEHTAAPTISPTPIPADPTATAPAPTPTVTATLPEPPATATEVPPTPTLTVATIAHTDRQAPIDQTPSIPPAGPTPTKVSQTEGKHATYRITSAAVGRTFGQPLNLAPLDDGRSYLIVTLEVQNESNESTRLDSDHFRVIADGSEIKEAGDVVDGVAESLQLASMGDMFGTYVDGGDTALFVLAYKVPTGVGTLLLHIDRDSIDRTIDLAPWLAENLAANRLVPTPTPTNTPTPLPTSTPTPRPTSTPTNTPTPVPTSTPTPLPTATPTPGLPSGVTTGSARATVLQVIDGRTIRIEQDGVKRTITLILLDTPTPGARDVVECYGDESKAMLDRLLPVGSSVWLEYDAVKRDDDGRTLAYVWAGDPAANTGFLVNRSLLQLGMSALDLTSPNVKYLALLQTAEQEAKDASRGLWGPCGSTHILLFPPTPTPAPPTPSPTPIILITDCGIFSSFDEANVYYTQHPEVQSSLDPNQDGRACEVYFGVDQPAVQDSAPQSISYGDGGGTSCGYTNVDGNWVPCPSDNPAGATARCNDGEYSYSQNHQGTCSHHGGVAEWLD